MTIAILLAVGLILGSIIGLVLAKSSVANQDKSNVGGVLKLVSGIIAL